jgi:uncharacterized membrane protein
MTALVLGLLIFLGMHSARIVADPWRTQVLASVAAKAPGKGLYTVVSLVGFGLIIWGYGAARQDRWRCGQPMVWTRHLASAADPGCLRAAGRSP